MQSIASVPTWFSDTWGISLEAAQVILSIVAILMVLLPVLYLTKGKGLTIPAVMFILVEFFLIGIGWMPFWIAIVTITVIALGVARIGANMAGG